MARPTILQVLRRALCRCCEGHVLALKSSEFPLFMRDDSVGKSPGSATGSAVTKGAVSVGAASVIQSEVTASSSRVRTHADIHKAWMFYLADVFREAMRRWLWLRSVPKVGKVQCLVERIDATDARRLRNTLADALGEGFPDLGHDDMVKAVRIVFSIDPHQQSEHTIRKHNRIRGLFEHSQGGLVRGKDLRGADEIKLPNGEGNQQSFGLGDPVVLSLAAIEEYVKAIEDYTQGLEDVP